MSLQGADRSGANPDDTEAASDNLADVLRRAARAATDRQLLAAFAVGVGACATVLALRPWGWRGLMCAATALAALGAWGMLDRERRDQAEAGDTAAPGRGGALVRFATAAVGLVGWLALVAFVFSIAGLAVGTWNF